MSFHFINGTSVWFSDATQYEADDNNGTITVRGKRNKFIATVIKAHVLFYCFNETEVTTFGRQARQSA